MTRFTNMTRAELDEEAEKVGLNPDDYKNIAEITEALENEGLTPDEIGEDVPGGEIEPGQRVTVTNEEFASEDGPTYAEVLDFNEEEKKFRVRLDSGEKVSLSESDLSAE